MGHSNLGPLTPMVMTSAVMRHPRVPKEEDAL
jgi:hypothetical protein